MDPRPSDPFIYTPEKIIFSFCSINIQTIGVVAEFVDVESMKSCF